MDGAFGHDDRHGSGELAGPGEAVEVQSVLADNGAGDFAVADRQFRGHRGERGGHPTIGVVHRDRRGLIERDGPGEGLPGGAQCGQMTCIVQRRHISDVVVRDVQRLHRRQRRAIQ